MIEGYLQRMRRMQQIVEDAERNVPDTMPDAQIRLQQMRQFYGQAVLSNERLLQQLSVSANEPD